MLRQFGTASLITAFLASGTAFASGYEKAILWGGRTAGVAGIGSPYIQGPQALYFNPAGLVSDRQGHSVDFNLSALQTKFKGPIDNSNTVAESEKKLLTPFGLMYGWTPNDKFGFGVGGYISAGSQAKFENVSIVETSTPTNTASGQTVETDLTVAEISLGGAYKVMDKLRVGAAYRYSMVSGKFSFINRGASNSVANVSVNDLKGNNAEGFRIGAQYELSESTKLGLSYRSQTDLVVKGKFGGTVKPPPTSSTPYTVTPNDATAKTTLPQAVNVGVLHSFNEKWNGLAEYVWTQYSKVEHITLDGTLANSSGTGTQADAPDLEMHWRDQHQVKLAGEYLGMRMPIRFGYIWTSQVTDDDYARAAFTAPGIAHTVTLGTGYSFGENFKLDGAIDYTTVKGDGNGATAGTSGVGKDIRKGEFETTAYALHLGLSYLF